MGRKRTRVDYRQLYKDHYGIEFGPEMAVHHIDFNRDNNSIDNLLLLPNKLHAKYHVAYQMLTGINGVLSINNEIRLADINAPLHYSQWLRVMADALDETFPWIRMKFDFDVMPRNVFEHTYRTDQPITERSVK